jgi:cytochrome oxidase assembly protein ShyY1
VVLQRIIRAAAGREVKPVLRRSLLWLLALALMALFVRAGLWQSGRALEKDALLAASASVLAERRPLPLDEAQAAMPAWVSIDGRFEPLPALRLDNQRRGARVGVQVFRAFRSVDGVRLWVDIGWRPLPADRRVPEEAPMPDGPFRLQGLLVPPPAAGLAIGPASSPLADGGALALRAEPTVLRAAMTGTAAAGGRERVLDDAVLRLDPAMPLGHERDLDLLANTLSPDKHRGYALQWFGFAVGLLLLSLFLQFRRRP